MSHSKNKKYSYDAIIFDFDGTLVDSAEIKTNAFGTLYEKYGEEIKRKVVEYHKLNEGVPRKKKFEHFEKKILKNNFNETIAENLSIKFSKIVLELIIKAPYMKGADKFLNEHYKNVKLFIASATPGQEMIEITQKRKMSLFFNEILGYPLNKSEIILFILRKYNLNKNKVIMVGDSISDYEGAINTKIDFLGFTQNTKGTFPEYIKTIDNFKCLKKHILI